MDSRSLLCSFFVPSSCDLIWLLVVTHKVLEGPFVVGTLFRFLVSEVVIEEFGLPLGFVGLFKAGVSEEDPVAWSFF